MTLSEKDSFSLTWKIENFSMCPHRFEDEIFSPDFVVYGSKWKLRMCPRGYNDANFIACFLEKMGSTDNRANITIDFEFIVRSVNAEKNISYRAENELFEYNSCIGEFEFCLREDILNIQNGFLPNNILTIEFRMQESMDEKGNTPKSPAVVSRDSYLPFSDSSLQKEIITTAARDELLDFEMQFAPRRYFIRTRIPVFRKRIIWPIRRFSALKPDQRLTIPVVTAGTFASFAMSLYLSGEAVNDQTAQIEIRIKESDLMKVCFVRCRITALNGLMKSQHTTEDEHFFEPTKKNDVWKFPTFLRMTTLMEEKYLDATQGTLILRCEFAFSNMKDTFLIEVDSLPLLSRYDNNDVHVQSISKQVYEEEEFSDVTLRRGDRTFKAHKNILAGRSPVLRAMFQTDMREKENGVIEIIDYDSDTIENFLAFIYTNNLEDLEPEKVMKLYSIADKYQVLSLKWRCSNLLKSTLSISNVCEVLILADLHQDEDLMNHAKHYIQINSDIILNSQMWKDLMQSNCSLASRVMLDLLTGKLGHL